MKVAVVGATGNVGSAVLRALQRDVRVREVVGIARRRPRVDVDKVTWRTADISRDDLLPVLEGADAVVHLAWLIQPSRDERVTYATNVEGSRRVFEAAVRAGAGAIVYASSIGAYSPGPKDRAVDESWATGGIPTSFYSRHKAAVERILDRVEEAHPHVRVARLRPGLIFQRDAASEIRRYFAGPFLPGRLVRRSMVPVIPRIPGLKVQAVHADDVAEAYRLVTAERAVGGAFNIAAEPPLDVDELARLLGARTVPVPPLAVRALTGLTWKLRLQPTSPGWFDMALSVPLMDTSRARTELGWSARRSSGDALLELMDGLRDGAGAPMPPLDPKTGGAVRERELATGVGARL
ncbi:MAG: NAD-dependent epimerase/dehydratase family protein [Solirubrobacterales bacterium]|nr:NAD-dependent epimerase/dehydratase family protein [Solirubrobacterales bacterium]